ncbi:MAG: SDR family NAD(P)-dependent oxidoreductase [Oscillospiraceae bacterium]|jgi:NAD(P)-dependent dehydrogenase (short-subunit alcohol dehydrogenase family)
MKFEGRVCVVTGGAGGIGRCIAEAFAKQGATVAFMDFNEEAGRETLMRLKVINKNSKHLFYYGDVAEEETLATFAKAVGDVCGGVDFLINNACLSRRGILSGCTWEDFNYVLRVGVSAPYRLTQLLLPLFREDAAIVNLASTRGFMSQADTESYSAAKGGILSLTHALAVSLSGKVRVNSISPGWIDTGAYHEENYIPEYTRADRLQHPSGRVGTPEDIARAVLFLCDPENDFINGQNLTVDGGMTKLMVYTGDNGWEYQA